MVARGFFKVGTLAYSGGCENDVHSAWPAVCVLPALFFFAVEYLNQSSAFFVSVSQLGQEAYLLVSLVAGVSIKRITRRAYQKWL